MLHVEDIAYFTNNIINDFLETISLTEEDQTGGEEESGSPLVEDLFAIFQVKLIFNCTSIMTEVIVEYCSFIFGALLD